jgi:hypothetical protein|tara:strand:- start:264 stop:491 length:228 start_codon:yes stop_codon:yes gene_type:complete
VKLVNLNSVGTVLDTETGDTYPMDVDGMPVMDESMNIMDMYDDMFSSQEWFDSLSDEDLNTIVGIYGTLPDSDYV